MALIRRIRTWFGDPALALTVLGLTAFGIAMIYSAGQLDAPKAGVTGAWRQQIMWFGFSMIAMFVVMRVQVRWLEWLAPALYVVGVVALIATLIVGTGQGTA